MSKINKLKSVESDSGKEELALIIDELKLIQFEQQATLDVIN